MANNLNEEDIRNCGFTIYAHVCTDGVYVGMSSDPVERWHQHVNDAHNKNSQYYNDALKVAIRRRQSTFRHYILDTAKFPKAAASKEAASIQFYSRKLNERIEVQRDINRYDYVPLENAGTYSIFLEKKSRGGGRDTREESDRVYVIAEIFYEFGRKRLRCIDGHPFKKGLRIQCSKAEREQFQEGDLVKVKVALSEKKGVQYLVAGSSSMLELIRRKGGR